MTEIDGVRLDSPCFALTLSDLLTGDAARDRIDAVASLSGACRRLRFLCVRDDAADAELLARAAEAAAETGLGVILESPSAANLTAAAGSLMPRRPLLVSPCDGLIGLASVLDLPVAVPFSDPSDAGPRASEALAAGCRDAVLVADVPSMKGVLECTVAAVRSADVPVACRGWSGEYALAVASVGALRGCSLAVLDDLDPDACRVLDALMDGMAGTGFERPPPDHASTNLVTSCHLN